MIIFISTSNAEITVHNISPHNSKTSLLNDILLALLYITAAYKYGTAH
jgi:hypothetical protein